MATASSSSSWPSLSVCTGTSTERFDWFREKHLEYTKFWHDENQRQGLPRIDLNADTYLLDRHTQIAHDGQECDCMEDIVFEFHTCEGAYAKWEFFPACTTYLGHLGRHHRNDRGCECAVHVFELYRYANSGAPLLASPTPVSSQHRSRSPRSLHASSLSSSSPPAAALRRSPPLPQTSSSPPRPQPAAATGRNSRRRPQRAANPPANHTQRAARSSSKPTPLMSIDFSNYRPPPHVAFTTLHQRLLHAPFYSYLMNILQNILNTIVQLTASLLQQFGFRTI